LTQHRFLLGFTLTSGIVLAGLAPEALAQTCTAISRIPYTINSSGQYCLSANLTTSGTTGSAIEVAADNVVIDLKGFTLDGSGGGTGTRMEAIHSINRRAITVRNGRIVGFFYGVHLDLNSSTNAGSHLVENLRIERARYIGLNVEGPSNLVRNNLILDTGGGGYHPDGMTACEQQYNGSVQALNNTIINVGFGADESPDGMMIYCNTALVIGNRLVNVSDSGIGLAGGYCKDNVLQYIGGKPYDRSNGNGCTLVGSTNFNFP
jgi:hypothetical protein